MLFFRTWCLCLSVFKSEITLNYIILKDKQRVLRFCAISTRQTLCTYVKPFPSRRQITWVSKIFETYTSESLHYSHVSYSWYSKLVSEFKLPVGFWHIFKSISDMFPRFSSSLCNRQDYRNSLIEKHTSVYPGIEQGPHA